MKQAQSNKRHQAFTNLSIAINASGLSTRMGQDKSLIALYGKPVIKHVIGRVSRISCKNIFLVANQQEKYKYLEIPMVKDVFPDKGSLGGIYTAAYYSTTEFTFVIACDMPFVNPALLEFQASLSTPQTNIVVPRKDGHPQGLHAIYHKNCLAEFEQLIRLDYLKIVKAYEALTVRYIDPPEWQQFDLEGFSFFNLKTPEDMETARAIQSSLQ